MAAVLVVGTAASGTAGPARAETGSVALYCDVRDSRVDPAKQGLICDAFAAEVALRYPTASFAAPVPGPAPADDAGPFVTIETFFANETGAEVRIRYGRPGSEEVAGDRVGFSIADATLNAMLIRGFVNSVLDRSSLPFK